MFIELTLGGETGTKVLVNITQVSDITNGRKGVVISFGSEEYFRVKESYEEIKEKLNKAGKLL
ncbi:hypothetical protein ACFQ4Z_02680 [Oceanobacillus oncorhynchi subsp. oncorhynchi]|uniref:hypothetical protein n=1 Tax=Oceanobacillus oncorhynchi TaxID=545501 RepID=UPI0036257175